jgi:hypothetical protein
LILTTKIDRPPVITEETMKAAIKLVQNLFLAARPRLLAADRPHRASRVVTMTALIDSTAAADNPSAAVVTYRRNLQAR